MDKLSQPKLLPRQLWIPNHWLLKSEYNSSLHNSSPYLPLLPNNPTLTFKMVNFICWKRCGTGRTLISEEIANKGGHLMIFSKKTPWGEYKNNGTELQSQERRPERDAFVITLVIINKLRLGRICQFKGTRESKCQGNSSGSSDFFLSWSHPACRKFSPSASVS